MKGLMKGRKCAVVRYTVAQHIVVQGDRWVENVARGKDTEMQAREQHNKQTYQTIEDPHHKT